MRRALLQLMGLATWTITVASFAIVVGGFIVHVVNGGGW